MKYYLIIMRLLSHNHEKIGQNYEIISHNYEVIYED